LGAAGTGDGVLRKVEGFHEGHADGAFLDEVNAADGLLFFGRGIPGFGFFGVVVEERRVGLKNFRREIGPNGRAAFVFAQEAGDGED
jgi:hypothetical protein